MKPLHFSDHDIDTAIATLRRHDGREWISRGRGGDGVSYRAGVFYSIYVEDSDQQDSPFADEAALRRHLADIDVGSFSSRYMTSVMEQLGAFASFDVADLEARADALAERKGVALLGPHRWRGVVGAITRQRELTFVALGADVFAVLSDDVVRELATEGVALSSWQGLALEVNAYLEPDLPSPGSVALRVSGRGQLRLV